MEMFHELMHGAGRVSSYYDDELGRAFHKVGQELKLKSALDSDLPAPLDPKKLASREGQVKDDEEKRSRSERVRHCHTWYEKEWVRGKSERCVLCNSRRAEYPLA